MLAMKNAIILYMNRSNDFSKDYASIEAKDIRHIILMSCYKEPIELIEASIQTLANQTEVRRIIMVVAFEERTPDKEDKCHYLEKKFHDCGFQRIIFTIHPYGLPNEIPGKCSNSNYGIRMAVKEMKIVDSDTDNILVTTCDADSKFPPQYVAALTSKYLKENRPALTTLYQSPLFYNWKLDGASFVTRVTGLLRSFLMLGALIPFNINTMSIYSYSLSLGVRGNYVHPVYQMEDIICLIRWMGITRQRLRISMIPVPVLSGPTSGETIEKDIMEWARQARRWTIGAAEVFHYFIIKSKRMPRSAAWSWGVCFVVYYGILLCTSGLYGLTSLISMFLLVKNVPVAISYVMYGLLGVQMLTFLMAFIIDIFIPKLLNIEEYICVVRNIFQYITTPFVLLAYSFVELYALHEIVFFGRKVCKHGAANKTALA
jgi:cellulose synthase/poly-beta-1,6-N-acetylglucosamine synthase-like glycosyltransferase